MFALGLSTPADPYLDEGTGVLRNLVGAATAAELAAFESDLTTVRTVQLQANELVPHTRDLAELRALHRHVFQDIFEWAGQLRMIDMRRGNGKFFAPAAGLSVNLNYFFEGLRAEDYLSGLERGEFLQGLARFYDDLNFIHPFREGNGRVQRLFWSRVSLEAGWLLDWRPIHGSELDEVSRAAREDGDLVGLVGALGHCLSKPTRSRDA